MKIIELVVPEGRQGLPNLSSTKQVRQPFLEVFSCTPRCVTPQILENWRTKRVIDPQKIDEALSILNSRPNIAQDTSTVPQLASSSSQDHLPRNDVFKRIEEDRERHKRLRERRWVQSIAHNTADYRALPLACFLPLTESVDGERELPIDIEFDNEWETTSDWNEDDDEAAAEESELCFRAPGEGPMDLS